MSKRDSTRPARSLQFGRARRRESMYRLFVVGWTALLSPAVLAQPKAPIVLKGPASGRTADQLFASGLSTWAGQLSAETHVLKAELTAATAGPPLVKAA